MPCNLQLAHYTLDIILISVETRERAGIHR